MRRSGGADHCGRGACRDKNVPTPWKVLSLAYGFTEPSLYLTTLGDLILRVDLVCTHWILDLKNKQPFDQFDLGLPFQ